jgi:hypothetical protein
MLEQERLSLEPWAFAGAQRADGGRGQSGGRRRRAIRDAATGQVLGFACWRAENGAVPLRWLTWPVLEVHEADDEPLVFTVQRVWAIAPCWEVSDADGHPVGWFRERLIQDRSQRTWARIERREDGTETHFRGPDGTEWGTLMHKNTVVELGFSLALDGEPFAKMLLLGAALTMTG